MTRDALAVLIEAQKQECPEFLHRLYPKPSCWWCARNGAFHRAARLIRESETT